MTLQKLSKEQIEKVYKERMVTDFPKDELKPLAMIFKAIDLDQYECLGLFDEDSIVGYTFFVKLDNSYLVDYLATYPDIRNKGVGATLLELLDKHLANADRIIGEVENPEYTDNPEQKELQARRIGFYKRNGCHDTGLRVECFGVPFIVLETGSKRCGNADEAWELYQSFYKMILPKDKFEKNIKRLI